MACALPLRHMATLKFGGFDLGLGVQNRKGADIDADLRGQRLHLVFMADQRRLDEALRGGFDGTPQRHVRHGPARRPW